MKNLTTLALILAVAATTIADVPKQWKARYNALDMAIKKKNKAAFAGMIAEDFVLVGKDGKKSTKADFVKEVNGLFDSAKQVTTDINIKNVKKSGDMVDAWFDVKIWLHHSPKGSTMVHEVGVDTWRKIKGKWQIVKTVDSAFEMTEKK